MFPEYWLVLTGSLNWCFLNTCYGCGAPERPADREMDKTADKTAAAFLERAMVVIEASGGGDSPGRKGVQDLGDPLWVLQMGVWRGGDVGEADGVSERRSGGIRGQVIRNTGGRLSCWSYPSGATGRSTDLPKPIVSLVGAQVPPSTPSLPIAQWFSKGVLPGTSNIGDSESPPSLLEMQGLTLRLTKSKFLGSGPRTLCLVSSPGKLMLGKV